MAFKTVASLDADVTIALGKKDKETGKPYPKQIEGYYLGSRRVKTNRGESSLHFFQTEDGNVGVWGTTDLDRKLGSVKIGTMVRATSTGTKATPKGDMFTYKIEVDAENFITVEAADDSEETGTVDGSSDADDENGEADEEQAAELLAAERAAQKARAQAILNRKKN